MIIEYTSWYCSCHWNKRTSRINSMTRIIEIFLLFEMMFLLKNLKNRILYLPTISWENEVQLWWWVQWHQWLNIALLTINFATTRSFWIIFQVVSVDLNSFWKTKQCDIRIRRCCVCVIDANTSCIWKLFFYRQSSLVMNISKVFFFEFCQFFFSPMK